MRRVSVFSACLVVLVMILSCGSLLASGGYDQLYWIDAKGYILHQTEAQGGEITSFIQYRQYSQTGDKVKPGYFKCIRNGMEFQIAVKEIKQIRLKNSMDNLKVMLGSDKYKQLILILRDGRSFDVSVTANMGESLANHPYIELKYYNPVTKKYEFGGFAGNTIREINFE